MRASDTVHCSSCGKRVSGVDPELGLVVRAFIQCPECIERPQCMNCRHTFTDDETRSVFMSRDGLLDVGPFCALCTRIVRDAIGDGQ